MEIFYSPKQSFCPSPSQSAQVSAWNSCLLVAWGSLPQNSTSPTPKMELLPGSPMFLFILSFTDGINILWLPAMCQAHWTYNGEQDRHGHHLPKVHSPIRREGWRSSSFYNWQSVAERPFPNYSTLPVWGVFAQNLGFLVHWDSWGFRAGKALAEQLPLLLMHPRSDILCPLMHDQLEAHPSAPPSHIPSL